MNSKEHELSMMLFNKLKQQFPEIEFTGITESMESSEDLWVNIIMPEDEERAIALHEVAGEISTDILMDYGYHITVSSASKQTEGLTSLPA